jgi:hypothetical protein
VCVHRQTGEGKLPPVTIEYVARARSHKRSLPSSSSSSAADPGRRRCPHAELAALLGSVAFRGVWPFRETDASASLSRLCPAGCVVQATYRTRSVRQINQRDSAFARALEENNAGDLLSSELDHGDLVPHAAIRTLLKAFDREYFAAMLEYLEPCVDARRCIPIAPFRPPSCPRSPHRPRLAASITSSARARASIERHLALL